MCIPLEAPHTEVEFNYRPARRIHLVKPSKKTRIVYVMSRKRARSIKSDSGTEADEPAFQYAPVKDEPAAPDYICYPNQPACQPCFQPCVPQACVPQPGFPMTTYQNPSGYQQYACYNPGYPFPGPAVCTPVNYQSPVALPEPQGDRIWLGRSKAQVDEDNVKIAVRENVYKYDAMKPAGAAADQLFWVVELDGRTTLRDFRTIDEDLGPGKWERDPRFNNAYFIRDEEKKAEDK